MLTNIFNKLIKLLVYSVQIMAGNLFFGNKFVVLYINNTSDEITAEIRKRLQFFVPHSWQRVRQVNSIWTPHLWTTAPLLVLGKSEGFAKFLIEYRRFSYHVDYTCNPWDGGEWCRLSLQCSAAKPDIRKAQQAFISYIQALQSHGFKKAYIIGTGPSLARAIEHPWVDGYRIVCNTIVRDRELWHHIKPHFIVAGDAIYHFGFTTFAKSFRADLKQRLLETDTRFLYPSLFHEIVMREFSDVSNKLIPIPFGPYQDIHRNLQEHFMLPKLGNVLNLMLLPLGCTLAKQICLWGFDGRSPTDTLFWANSSKHTYSEYMDELKNAHPAFFSHNVPTSDPTKYFKEVHGDILDKNLTEAERLGWRFIMMHETYTPALQKRREERYKC